MYPTTGRCSNGECPKHKRIGTALSFDQLLREYTHPPLFHGRHWGQWTLDVERLCLVYRAEPVERGGGETGIPTYTAYLGHYEIDLETTRQSSSLLDWIFQVGKKDWATARVTKDFQNALDDIIHPQQNLCSGGGSKTIKNPGAFLRERIATVGMPREAVE